MVAKERWILISNCQTYGLAQSMQMLARDISIDPVDVGQYNAHIAHYNDSFAAYDRVLVSAAASGLPGADFSRSRRVDRLPKLVYTGFHPDLTYIMNGGTVVDGPIGAYHSMIAFVAYGLGRSVEEALSLFNSRTYAACGYFDTWKQARQELIANCGHYGLDISEALPRWGRRGAFMYGNNHPRIHVLYDVARIYLEREGYATYPSDILPQDSLVTSGVFATYPEIGERLGVPGAYLFKRISSYSQIGLRQFVEESFATYDLHAPDTLKVYDYWQPTYSRVSGLLQDQRGPA